MTADERTSLLEPLLGEGCVWERHGEVRTEAIRLVVAVLEGLPCATPYTCSYNEAATVVCHRCRELAGWRAMLTEGAKNGN